MGSILTATMREEGIGMDSRIYLVKTIWDPEAKVWVATSDDIPGLVVEVETIERLFEELQVLVPELLKADEVLPGDNFPEIPIHLMAERHENIRLN